MPWQIIGGRPVRVTPEVDTTVSAPEVPIVTQTLDDPDPKYGCPHCGKTYKTERGIFDHIEAKHGDQ